MPPFNNILAELHPSSQLLEQFSELVAKELPYVLAGSGRCGNNNTWLYSIDSVRADGDSDEDKSWSVVMKQKAFFLIMSHKNLQ